MLITIWIEKKEPIAGTVSAEGHHPRPFEGWLELLAAVSELVAAAAGRSGSLN